MAQRVMPRYAPNSMKWGPPSLPCQQSLRLWDEDAMGRAGLPDENPDSGHSPISDGRNSVVQRCRIPLLASHAR